MSRVWLVLAAVLLAVVFATGTVGHSPNATAKAKKAKKSKKKCSSKANSSRKKGGKKRRRCVKKKKKSRRYYPVDGPYQIGNPTVKELWVDPTSGNDSNSGSSRSQALRTVREAWGRVPQGRALTTGYKLMLTRGTYSRNSVVEYWEDRHGTYNAPIIFAAADGLGTVRLPSMNVYNSDYIYLLGVNLIDQGGDLFHCEQCDHVLIRDAAVRSTDPGQETIKVNQSQYVYIENSDISGAGDNSVDWVAVQYGHMLGNKIHNAGDWCAYTKGGSAYIRIAGNEIYDCGTGGFTAGQGTGLQYMTAPWLHYEAYDIKVYNNIIHDTEGAGLGVNGGFNVLLAYNTLYRVGSRSHLLEFVFGLRSCDSDDISFRCAQSIDAGGWGIASLGCDDDCTRIPNRNVFVYNNLIYNPDGYRSQWQQFEVSGPYSGGGQNGSSVPDPARADENLQIRGNLIWNGSSGMNLGVGDSSGCRNSNPTCNTGQLESENSINRLLPQLSNPGGDDFKPANGSNIGSVTTYLIPEFSWAAAPSPPTVPKGGTLANTVTKNIVGASRGSPGQPGAY